MTAPNAITYPAPAGVPASRRYAVSVDGQASFTYQTTSPAHADTTAGHHLSWTSFDLRGRCEVRVRRLSGSVGDVVVRPRSAGVTADVDRGEVVLRLDRPVKVSIECDGDLTDALLLFANEPQTDIPRPDDPGVVRFGPGVHEIGKRYPLKPATTYYLAPGAYLKGSLAGGGDGTRVIGRGVVSGADYAWPGHQQEKNPARVDLVKLEGSGVDVSGVTLVDSPFYVVIVRGRQALCRDLKILAWHFNTDGISAGEGARIEDCFFRVADDAVKPFVSDTRIRRCVFWMDRVSPFQLTYNAMRDSGGSSVSDCDVIHHVPFWRPGCLAWGPIFGSYHGGTAHIHDVVFDDIRVEGSPLSLVRLQMHRNPWSIQEGEWGRFSRLRFRNVQLDEPPRGPSRLLGHDEAHPIEDVVFENLRIAGRPIRAAEQVDLETNEFVRGLQFR